MAIKISGTTVIDNSNNVNAGIVTANQFSGSGDNLIFSPTITSFSPTDGATGVNALSSPDIIFTYNQPVGLGTTGTINLRTGSATGTIVESFNVGVSTRVTINGQTVTIEPTSNFDYDQDYYTVLPVGVVINNVGGNSALLDTYNFATESGPTLSSVQPSLGSTSVGLSTNVVFTFNKNIRVGVGTITLRTVSAGGTIIESYDVSSSNRLTFDTNTLTIDPTNNLDIDTNFFVVVPNNSVAGYAGINTYNFTSLDFSLSSINPADGATNVGVDTNITLTFSSPAALGTGNIELRQGSTSGTLVESFNVSTSSSVTAAENSVVINPTNNLGFNTSFHTIIPSTAITNYAGLNTTGTGTYSFTTRDVNLGDAYEGGFLMCKASPIRWIVAPNAAIVSTDWYSTGNAVTCAETISGCTGWFVPSPAQLQNPGFVCRIYWESTPGGDYWTNTQNNGFYGCRAFMSSGGTGALDKSCVLQAVAFRCVTY